MWNMYSQNFQIRLPWSVMIQANILHQSPIKLSSYYLDRIYSIFPHLRAISTQPKYFQQASQWYLKKESLQQYALDEVIEIQKCKVLLKSLCCRKVPKKSSTQILREINFRFQKVQNSSKSKFNTCRKPKMAIFKLLVFQKLISHKI